MDLGVLEFLDRAQADGRIRFAGFSFHDEAEFFRPIVDAYDWDFCQIQYNYMDIEYQAGAAGLAYAADRGLGVTIMEPLKGGRLAGRTPAAVQALWDSAPVKRTPVEWALRFVWDDRRVSSVLSGMTAMDHVVTNVALADEGHAGSLSRSDLELIEQVREAYKARMASTAPPAAIACPVPSGIDIPLVLNFLNNVSLFENSGPELAGYKLNVDLGNTVRASECAECGQCEAACPQQLKVIEELAGGSADVRVVALSQTADEGGTYAGVGGPAATDPDRLADGQEPHRGGPNPHQPCERRPISLPRSRGVLSGSGQGGRRDHHGCSRRPSTPTEPLPSRCSSTWATTATSRR